MSKPDAWMPFFIGDYLADTMHLTTEMHGAYLLLLAHAWRSAGRIPADDSRLAAIVRLPLASWQAIKADVLAFWQATDDGAFTQKRLSEELARTQRSYDQKVNASRSAVARRKNVQKSPDGVPDGIPTDAPDDAPHGTPDDPSDGIHNHNHNHIHASHENPPTPFLREIDSQPVQPIHGGHVYRNDAIAIVAAYPRPSAGNHKAIAACADAIWRVKQGIDIKPADAKDWPPADAVAWMTERVAAYRAAVNGKEARFIPSPVNWFESAAYIDRAGWNPKGTITDAATVAKQTEAKRQHDADRQRQAEADAKRRDAEKAERAAFIAALSPDEFARMKAEVCAVLRGPPRADMERAGRDDSALCALIYTKFGKQEAVT